MNHTVCLDHVAIQTSDLDKAIFFYVNILGGDLKERRPFKTRHMAWIQFPNLKLEIFSKRQNEELATWQDNYCGPVHLSFVVRDLDGFIADAKALGACFHPSHPTPFIPPVAGAPRIAYLLGPDGEEVEVRPSAA